MSKNEKEGIFGQRRFQATAYPNIQGGIVVNVPGSIGIAIQTSVSLSGDDLIKSADDAMYQANQNGKNQYFFVDPLHPVIDARQG